MRYAMLDHLILAAIERSGDCPQHDRQVLAESRRIAAETGRDEMRVFDGRLQALRRCGAIAYRARKDGGRGWELT